MAAGASSTPTCDTTFDGGPGGDWTNVANWTNGIPDAHSVACVPPDAAELAGAWVGVTRIVDPRIMEGAEGASRKASQAFVGVVNLHPDPPPPTTLGVCCLGSNCVEGDYFDCMILGGYFRSDVLDCSLFNPCLTGACCVSDPGCLDLGGGALDEEECDLTHGTYVGGAQCGATDPCQRLRIPQGFEIVEVTPGMEALQRRHPHINNCGEVVVHIGTEESSWPAEIYLYDNGHLEQLTNNDVSDNFPDINDAGTIVWNRWNEDISNEQIMMQEKENLTALDASDLGVGSPRINNLEHVVWSREESTECPIDRRDDIHYFDGLSSRLIYDDGLSNQSPTINNLLEILIPNTLFECGGGFADWTSDMLLYRDGEIIDLPQVLFQTQVPSMNDLGRKGWAGTDDIESLVEVMENGVSTILPGRSCCEELNNKRDVVHNWHTSFTPWQIYLDRDGERYRISNDPDIVNIMDNSSGDLNDFGEIAWHWHPNGGFAPSGTRLMRRIRNGDVTFDGVVDINDFIPLPGCWTGSVETDGLCECRFFDIDHDRDVDDDDFALFMRVYSGPQEDCNNNGILDLTDLIEGTSSDCNLNGVPDLCDLTAGTDIDGDGMLDECCVAPTVAIDVLGARNRMLAITIDPSVSQPAAQATPPESPPARGGGFASANTKSLNHASSAPAGPLPYGRGSKTPLPYSRGSEKPLPYGRGSVTPLPSREGLGEGAAGFTYIRHAPPISYALRVTLNTLPAGFDAYEGTTLWATAPFEICENSGQGLATPPDQCSVAPGPQGKKFWAARLVCDPALAHYTDWSAVGTVHLFHETIVPGGMYSVQSILDGCGIDFAGNYSAANSLPTSTWGDVVMDVTQCPPAAGNGDVDIVGDVVSVIRKFANAECAVSKSRADLEPGHLDFRVNITDALRALRAFTGISYPFTPTDPPCP
jgi:hypothetical protein